MNSHLHTPPERIATLHAIRDRHKGQACTTQKVRLLDALQTLEHVTTFEAMRYLDIYDPRPRKLALVRSGFEIVTTWRRLETESGEPHRIGVYSLKRGTGPRDDLGTEPKGGTPNDDAPTVASGQGTLDLEPVEGLDFDPSEASQQAAQASKGKTEEGQP